MLETEGPGASQPVSKKLGLNPALSFQRLVSKTKLLTVEYVHMHRSTCRALSLRSAVKGRHGDVDVGHGHGAVVVETASLLEGAAVVSQLG